MGSVAAVPAFAAAPAAGSGSMMLTGGLDAADGTLNPGGTGLAPELDATGVRLPRDDQFAAYLAT